MTRCFGKDIDDDAEDSLKGRLGLNLLYSPSEPLVDFIFVHGLGGGSRKTWSKTSSISHYWPQEWLPKDPAFKNVRVLSFGYYSDYIKGKANVLNIHHFGRALLGQIMVSPYLSDTNNPIVLIGHSMGGLVIKKVYILAKEDPIYEGLTKRFHTIFFLATPHRGSDWAKVLNKILRTAYSSRAYVADLDGRSKAIKSINEDFHKDITAIGLWSFYETQKSRMGFFKTLIVDPDSATLGYCKEKRVPMNANHRSICKFNTRADQNYVTLRNALASTVNTISEQGTSAFIVLSSPAK